VLRLRRRATLSRGGYGGGRSDDDRLLAGRFDLEPRKRAMRRLDSIVTRFQQHIGRAMWEGERALGMVFIGGWVGASALLSCRSLLLLTSHGSGRVRTSLGGVVFDTRSDPLRA
jgi:hypothetical protein